MKCKTTLLWSIINVKDHKSLEKECYIISNLEPLVLQLFPGIHYDSVTGFNFVMINCVRPALRTQFPDLLGAAEESISSTEEREISKFKDCNGLEWTYSTSWKNSFQGLLKDNT
jgi:hypothetical protein